MSIKLLIEIVLTLLRARLRQTIVAATGVTFGITMFVTLLSFMNGLNGMLDGLIGNRTPHVRLFNDIAASPVQPVQQSGKYEGHHFIQSIKASLARKELYNVERIRQTLDKDPRVAGYSRRVSTQVFFNSGPTDISGLLNGIDVRAEVQWYKFKDYVTTGNPEDLNQVPNSVILGKPLADILGATIGNTVRITTTSGEQVTLKVVGYYQSGVADYDKTQSFTSVKTVQKVLGKPNSYITDLYIKLHRLEQAPAAAREFRKIFGVSAEDIQTANAQFETGTSVRNIISYAVGITLLIVAGFGIYNILNMMIYEKMDTIAILKATGFAGKDVRRVFMSISIGIGISGCLAGLVFGSLLSHMVDNLPFKTAALPTIDTFPVDHSFRYYLIAIIFSLITTFFAGFFPARKASRIDPVIIIRGK